MLGNPPLGVSSAAPPGDAEPARRRLVRRFAKRSCARRSKVRLSRRRGGMSPPPGDPPAASSGGDDLFVRSLAPGVAAPSSAASLIEDGASACPRGKQRAAPPRGRPYGPCFGRRERARGGLGAVQTSLKKWRRASSLRRRGIAPGSHGACCGSGAASAVRPHPSAPHIRRAASPARSRNAFHRRRKAPPRSGGISPGYTPCGRAVATRPRGRPSDLSPKRRPRSPGRRRNAAFGREWGARPPERSNPRERSGRRFPPARGPAERPSVRRAPRLSGRAPHPS